jgi:acetyltransferase-like isoleucine patch superfamily enzyme
MSLKYLFQGIISKIYCYLAKQPHYYHFKKLSNSGMLTFGKHSYGIPEVYVFKGSEAKVVIGKFCSLAPDITLITGGIHPTDWVSTYPFRSKWNLKGADQDGTPATKGDIVVGNDVWIGTHVFILSGVKIGDGAVICTGSIVLNDIPPYAIAGGVPAKVIKMRFQNNEIEELLSIRWWEWEDDKILKYVDYLSSPRIKDFLDSLKGSEKP